MRSGQMESLCFFLLLIGGALVTAESLADMEQGYDHSIDYSVDLCLSQGSVDGINHPKNGMVDSRRNAYIFVDQVISCDGRVGQWQFFPEEPGTFYAAIWRPDRASGQVLFVGANRIVVEIAQEIQYFEVPLHHRLYAEVGDVVGIYFDEDEEYDEDETVLAVERTDLLRANPDILSEMTVLEGVTAEAISGMKGTKLFPMGDLSLPRMSVALRAEIVGTSRVMRFAWDDNKPRHGEGRAEIFKGGIWGTVCDKWFHQRGWPFLFCREMGFPDPYYSYYTSTERRHKAPEDTPIHVKNPRCKPSQNLTMISCDLHENQNCEDHAYDLYIICRKKVELRYGAVEESEGIPFMFDHGYWGTICDSTDPDDIPVMWQAGVRKQQLDNHWCNAFCKELGFTGCERVSYAKGVRGVTSAAAAHVKKYAIANQSPECEVTGATNIDQCPPSPRKERCSHDQDYYVVCQTEHLY